MSFINQSIELKKSNYTVLSNSFITSFMPDACENAVKVYLMGLYFSQLNEDVNTLEHFCEMLKMTKEEVKDAFLFWEKENLVKILDIDAFEIIYLPLNTLAIKFKPIDEQKYDGLSVLIQSFLDRGLTPNEFQDYINLIEQKHLEKDALLMIIKYCAQKDRNIPAKYILSVANNWIASGIFTTKKVEEKIKELDKTSEDIKNLFLVLGLNRTATIDECDMYRVWTRSFYYTSTVILLIAESLNKKGGMKALDNKIRKYHSLQLYSIEEIQEYEKNRKHYVNIAKEICTRLGVFVENFEPVISNYLNSWLNKGFMDETLKMIATFCFKNEHNSLSQMDLVVQKLYKQGCVSLDAITQYINDLGEIDNNIKEIFEKLLVKRIVTNQDREMYNTWCNEWKIEKDLLSYAIKLSSGKTLAFQYLNKVLTNFHEKNVKTVEEAKNCGINFKEQSTTKTTNVDMNRRSYSDEELNRLFDNLREIDV